MKFSASRLSKGNFISPIRIEFRDHLLILNPNTIKAVEIETWGIGELGYRIPIFGFSTFKFSRKGKRFALHGFTIRQCEELTVAIHISQIKSLNYQGLYKHVLKDLQDFGSMLREYTPPRKFEIPLVELLTDKIIEGLAKLDELYASERSRVQQREKLYEEIFLELKKKIL